MSRPLFALGDTIELADGRYQLVEMSGGALHLRNRDTGSYRSFIPAELSRQCVAPARLDGFDPQAVEHVSSHDQRDIADRVLHLEEIINGTPLREGAPRRPEFEPATNSLRSRVRRKSEELIRANVAEASVATLYRQVSDYTDRGPAGLVDRRSARRKNPLGNADPRIVGEMRRILKQMERASTTTRRIQNQHLRKNLRDAYPGEPIELPAESTLSRWWTHLDTKRTAFGDATTRQTKANQHEWMFKKRPVSRPGMEVQIDSTPLDLLVLGDNGKPTRPHLTVMLDTYTRSVMASMIVPEGTKAWDHVLLLATALAPHRHRKLHPSFENINLPEAPWTKLVDDDELDRLQAARPVIFPELIVSDNGADFVSRQMKAALSYLGISTNEASPHDPTAKPNVERFFGTVNRSFCALFKGAYPGGSVKDRGEIDETKLVDIATLTALFDLWVSVVYQENEQDDLVDPFNPSQKFSPNALYGASFAFAGYVPRLLDEHDFIAMMPSEARLIRPEGITIQNRRYDSPELQEFRGARAPKTNRTGGEKDREKWDVRFHPYDPSFVWVLNPITQEWITCPWQNEDEHVKPFHRSIRAEARRMMKRGGERIQVDLLTLIEQMTNSDAAQVREAQFERRLEASKARERGAGLDIVRDESSETPQTKPDGGTDWAALADLTFGEFTTERKAN